MTNGKIREIDEFIQPPPTIPIHVHGTMAIPVTEVPLDKQVRQYGLLTKTEWLILIECAIGFALIYTGITNAGSFYLQSSRMAGQLAMFWYVMQVATMMEIVGTIFLYDAWIRFDVSIIDKLCGMLFYR